MHELGAAVANLRLNYYFFAGLWLSVAIAFRFPKFAAFSASRRTIPGALRNLI